MAAENTVRIDGATSTALTTNAGTGPSVANSWNMRITDGVDIAPVSTSALGNALLVSSGTLSAGTSLNAVTAAATGATVDFGSAKSNITSMCVGTGTLAGTATIELSLNNVDWASSTVTIAATTGAVAGYSIGRPARYARVSLGTTSGAGTITATLMGA
mgnify:CR=1 FL=1